MKTGKTFGRSFIAISSSLKIDLEHPRPFDAFAIAKFIHHVTELARSHFAEGYSVEATILIELDLNALFL
jgi:hypothetical protein